MLLLTTYRYGTANRAFDPDVENDPDAVRRVPPDNIYTGTTRKVMKRFKSYING